MFSSSLCVHVWFVLALQHPLSKWSGVDVKCFTKCEHVCLVPALDWDPVQGVFLVG